MPSFRLTKQAKDDLKSIARYTQEIWGRDQRNKYLGILDNCFHLLADEPDLGVACDEIRKITVSFVLNDTLFSIEKLQMILMLSVSCIVGWM